MTFPNKQQRRALDSRNSKMLVLAPAGTGKTQLLARKSVEEARRLKRRAIKFSAIEPRVLVLTHTTNARDGIQKRINLTEPDAWGRKTILVRTFHGYALKLINQYGPTGYTVIGDCDEKIFQQILKDGVLSAKLTGGAVTEILSVIEDHKIQGISLKKIIKRKYPNLKDRIKFIKEVTYELKRRKKKEGIISVNEIPSVFIQLVENGKLPLESIDLPRSIIVDEFHDTLFTQWEMIKKLTRSNTRLFVAGDPDQTIFEWAGASRKRFDDFRSHFPSHAEFRLTINYRCSQEIVTLCNHIRRQIKNKSGLKSRGTTYGPKPLVVCGKSNVDLSDYIVKEILKQLKSGRSLEDIAVIYRFHRDRRNLIEHLNANNIPHKVYEARSRRIRPVIRVIFSAHRIIETYIRHP